MTSLFELRWLTTLQHLRSGYFTEARDSLTSLWQRPLSLTERQKVLHLLVPLLLKEEAQASVTFAIHVLKEVVCSKSQPLLFRAQSYITLGFIALQHKHLVEITFKDRQLYKEELLPTLSLLPTWWYVQAYEKATLLVYAHASASGQSKDEARAISLLVHTGDLLSDKEENSPTSSIFSIWKYLARAVALNASEYTLGNGNLEKRKDSYERILTTYKQYSQEDQVLVAHIYAFSLLLYANFIRRYESPSELVRAHIESLLTTFTSLIESPLTHKSVSLYLKRIYTNPHEIYLRTSFQELYSYHADFKRIMQGLETVS